MSSAAEQPLLRSDSSGQDEIGSSTPRDRTSSNVVKRQRSSPHTPKTEEEKKHQALMDQYQAKQMLTMAAHKILPNLGKKYDEKLRVLNVHMAILATLILGLLLFYIDFCFDRDTLVFDDSYSTCPAAFWCKSLAWGLYMVFLERLICYYAIKSESLMDKWGFSTRLQAFWNVEVGTFLMEAFLNALIPLPATDNWGMEGYIVMTLIFIRLYLWLRVMRDYSPFWKARHSVTLSGPLSKVQGKIDSGTVAIAYFHTYTWFVVVVMGASGICILAYLMHLYERLLWESGNFEFVRVDMDPQYLVPGNTPADLGYSPSPYSTYFNCVWFTIVTGSTVGYGDFAPRDWQGRFVASFIILFGLILTSLLSSIVINELEPKESEEAVQIWQAHIASAEELQYTAVRIIQIVWRRAKRNKKRMGQKKRTDKERKAKIRKHRAEMRRLIKPWLKRMRKAKKTFEETSETPSETLEEMILRRAGEINEKMNIFESLLKEHKPEQMQQVEEQYQAQKYKEATDIIKSVLRKRLDHDEYRLM